MAINLGAAYVDIVPSTGDLAPRLRDQVEKPLTTSGERAGQGFGSRFADGLSRMGSTATRFLTDTLVGAATVAATAASGVVVTSLFTGFNRFVALENAAKMLDQMGLSAQDAERLMAALNDTLTGTAFALDEGAGTLSRLVSAGVGLDRIPGILGMITDAAAFGQTSMGEVGTIFSRIASQGRVTAAELNMLVDRNIPAFGLLADAIGITETELRDMVSAGKLDADTFFAAWEEGAKGFGESGIIMEGAAKSMGDTTAGALSNLRAAIGRFGAQAFEPLFQAIVPFADAMRGALNELAPRVAEWVGDFASSDGFQRFLDWVVDVPSKIGPLIDAFLDLGVAVGPIAGLFGALGLAGLKNLPFIGGFVPALHPLIGVFLGLVAASPELQAALQNLWDAFQPLIEAAGRAFVKALEVLAPVLAAVFDWIADNAVPVAWALGVIIGGFVVGAVMNLATALLGTLLNPVGLVIAALALLVFGFVWLYEHSEGFRRFVDDKLAPALENLVKLFGGIVVIAVGKAITVFETVKSIIEGVSGAIGDLIGVVDRLLVMFDRLSGFLFGGSINSKIDGMLQDLNRASSGLDKLRHAGILKFHTGGIVPGAPGQEVLAVLKAGETVLPTHNPGWSAGAAGVTIDVTGGTDDLARLIAKWVRTRHGGNVQAALGGAR